jgi:hypothetical protein
MRPDLRRAERKTLNWLCVISTVDGTLVGQCTVRDISRTGARITLDDASVAPEQFVLRLTRNGAIGRQCRTVWRAPSNIGVAFVSHRP